MRTQIKRSQVKALVTVGGSPLGSNIRSPRTRVEYSKSPLSSANQLSQNFMMACKNKITIFMGNFHDRKIENNICLQLDSQLIETRDITFWYFCPVCENKICTKKPRKNGWTYGPGINDVRKNSQVMKKWWWKTCGQCFRILSGILPKKRTNFE